MCMPLPLDLKDALAAAGLWTGGVQAELCAIRYKHLTKINQFFYEQTRLLIVFCDIRVMDVLANSRLNKGEEISSSW